MPLDLLATALVWDVQLIPKPSGVVCLCMHVCRASAMIVVDFPLETVLYVGGLEAH